MDRGEGSERERERERKHSALSRYPVCPSVCPGCSTGSTGKFATL